jgi:hypothetical protein
MFNYLFPIFCFGLVITGIVFLGLLEASKQVKTEAAKSRLPLPRGGDLAPATTHDGRLPRSTNRNININE